MVLVHWKQFYIKLLRLLWDLQKNCIIKLLFSLNEQILNSKQLTCEIYVISHAIYWNIFQVSIFSCQAAVKNEMSKCPGLNVAHHGKHKDLSQPVNASFSQSEEAFYRSHITTWIVIIIKKGFMVLCVIVANLNMVRLLQSERNVWRRLN